MADALAILYIASQLPKRSETFVYREVLALRAAGKRVLVASVHPPERGLGEPQLDALADEAIPIYGAGVFRMLVDAVIEKWTHLPRTIGIFWQAHFDAWGNDDVKGIGILKIFWQAIAAMALARRVRKLGVTHIHAHMAHVPTTIAMYAARQLGISFSFTGHAADIFRDRALLKPKLERAKFVSCISEWHREFYRAIVPRPDEDYPVIRCGVDTKEFSARADEAVCATDRGADRRSALILGVGRLVPKKGFDLLLDALAKLRDSGLKFRAIIGGDGPEFEKLKSLRVEKKLTEMVEMPGALANRDVRKLLGETSIFVLPCRVDSSGDKDGIPVVLMEAMACGVPCVSGDLPAIRELIADGKSGRMVPPGDVAALTSALEQLLRNDNLRADLGGIGRRRVEEEFSTEVNTARLIKCFDRSTKS